MISLQTTKYEKDEGEREEEEEERGGKKERKKVCSLGASGWVHTYVSSKYITCICIQVVP